MRFFEQVIKRPVLTTAILIAIAGLAAHALIGLSVGVDPGLGRPAISISVPYSGVSTATVEREVVRPIERRVAGIPGIVRSEATARDDQGRVTLYFDFASDLHRAFQSIYDSVAVVRRELPIQAGEPVITHDDRGGSAADAFALDAPGRPTPIPSLDQTFLIGALLAGLALVAFLRSWQSALIIALSTLGSALAALAVVGHLGPGITPMTLLGLALAIGILLDDAVVVRESIVRHRELRSAAMPSSAGRPVGPVIVGTLVTAAVFAPLSRTGGVAGNLLATLTVTFIVAALASSIASMTIVPLLSRTFAADRRRTQRIGSAPRIDLWFDALIDRYHELLASTLNHRRRTAVFAVGLLGVVLTIASATARTELIPAPHPGHPVRTLGEPDDARVNLEIRGPDSRTLVGVAQHVAEEAMAVPGMRGVSVSPRVILDAAAPGEIEHLDTARVAYVHMALPDASAHSILRELNDRLALVPLPPGYQLTQSGDIADRDDMFHRVVATLGLGVALIYVLLALRWRSSTDPLAIVFALALVLIGVAGAMWISGATLNLFTVVGAAFGMVLLTRHAAPLIDLARGRLHHDMSMRVSLIEAARVRFRPIVATSVGVIVWMLPIVFTAGASAGPYRALGIAVIGGAIASVATALLVVPMLCSALADLRERAVVWTSTLRSVSSSVLPLEPGD